MKVGIVGCGIIGSYLAWKLAKRGYKVTVFEQKSRLGKLACSGLASERIWNFIPEKRELVQNQISHAIINFPQKIMKLDFRPKMLALNRSALDRYVWELARKAHAKLILQKIDKLPEDFDLIIGCDGALSTVRENLGLSRPNFRLGLVSYTEDIDDSNFVEVWPIKEGLAWRIPRGGAVEYGVLSSVKRAKEEHLHFCIKQNIRPAKQHSALVPQGLIIPNSSNVTLCGDAMGLTKPWSGGGIIWGLTAAEILIETFPDFKKYHSAVKRFFNPKILTSSFITKAVFLTGSRVPQLLPKERVIDSDFIF